MEVFPVASSRVGGAALHGDRDVGGRVADVVKAVIELLPIVSEVIPPAALKTRRRGDPEGGRGRRWMGLRCSVLRAGMGSPASHSSLQQSFQIVAGQQRRVVWMFQERADVVANGLEIQRRQPVTQQFFP